MKRLVIVAALLLVALFAALLVVPSMIDWNGYRSELERQASRIIDRPVRIGGSVSLQLLPTPYLSIEDVRIAGEDGRFGRPFLKVGAMSVRLAVPPLLSGEIEATEVTIRRPELQLSLDNQGRGNWRGLGGNGRSTATLMPASVSLNSVRIEDGMVRLVSADGTLSLTLNAVQGELAAPALTGPYRFKGTFNDGATMQELRLSAGPLDDPAGAKLRLSTMRGGEAGDTLSFDGVVRDLDAKPRVEGALTAKVRSWFVAKEPAALPPLEVTAMIAADTTRASVSNLQASLPPLAGGDGKPAGRTQEIRGQLTYDWSADRSWAAEITTQWLDLERWLPPVAVTAPRQAPFERLIDAIEPILMQLPPANRFRLQASVADAEISGGRIDGLAVTLDRDGETLALSHLIMGLPGRTRLSLAGQLGRYSEAQGGAFTLDFEGKMQLAGANIHRLLGWAWPAFQPRNAAVERAFLLEGDVNWSAERQGIDNVQAEIAGMTLSGRWLSRYAPTRELDVALDTDMLDLRGLWQPPATLTELFGTLQGLADMASTSASAPTASEQGGAAAVAQATMPAVGPDPAPATTIPLDFKVDLRVGRLLTDHSRLDDVAVQASRSGDRLEIATLRLGATGLGIEASGNLAGSNGAIGFTVSADQPAALNALERYFDLPVAGLVPELRGALLPLSLAGRYSITADAAQSPIITLDGLANAAQVSIISRGDWRGGRWPSSLTATVRHPDRERLAALIGSILTGSAAEAPTLPGNATVAAAEAVMASVSGTPAKLEIRLEGNGARAYMSRVRLDAGVESAEISGRIERAEGANDTAVAATYSFAGTVTARGESPAYWVAMLGLPTVLAQQYGKPFSIASELSRDATRFALANARAELDGKGFDFTLAIPHSPAGGAAFDLVAKGPGFDAIPWTEAVLAPLTLGAVEQRTASVDPALATSAAAPIWSQRRFDFSRLPAGKVKLDLDTLTLAPELTLGAARLEMVTGPAGVTVTRLEGDVFDGRLVAKGSLTAQPAGARLALDLALTQVGLEALARIGADATSTEGPAARGTGDLTLTATGSGLDPLSLIELVSGSGNVAVNEGEIANLSAFAVEAAAQAVLTHGIAPNADNLARLLSRRRLVDSFALAPAQAPVTLRDGVLTLGALVFDAPPAALTVTTAIDLRNATLDSDWVMTPKPFGTSSAKLPPVTFVYAGSLTALAALPAKLDTTALEKELIVRRAAGAASLTDGFWPDLPPVREEPRPVQPVVAAPPPAPPPAPPRKKAASGLTSAPPAPPTLEDIPTDGWATTTE